MPTKRTKTASILQKQRTKGFIRPLPGSGRKPT